MNELRQSFDNERDRLRLRSAGKRRDSDSAGRGSVVSDLDHRVIEGGREDDVTNKLRSARGLTHGAWSSESGDVGTEKAARRLCGSVADPKAPLRGLVGADVPRCAVGALIWEQEFRVVCLENTGIIDRDPAHDGSREAREINRRETRNAWAGSGRGDRGGVVVCAGVTGTRGHSEEGTETESGARRAGRSGYACRTGDAACACTTRDACRAGNARRAARSRGARDCGSFRTGRASRAARSRGAGSGRAARSRGARRASSVAASTFFERTRAASRSSHGKEAISPGRARSKEAQ